MDRDAGTELNPFFTHQGGSNSPQNIYDTLFRGANYAASPTPISRAAADACPRRPRLCSVRGQRIAI